MFPFTPDPRYMPAAGPPGNTSDTFDVVFVGRLSVAKGVPLLVDALRRLAHRDLRLVLVGGWRSPGMRRFSKGICAEDPRVEVRPGDPLPRLARRAAVRAPRLRGRRSPTRPPRHSRAACPCSSPRIPA